VLVLPLARAISQTLRQKKGSDFLSTLSTFSKKPRAVAGKAKGVGRRKRKQAGRPTADELERRKLRVMEVATDMFVNQGFAATTLIDIALVAQVATRTLYQHFGDKEAIFREVIFARNTAKVDPPELEDGDDLQSALIRAAHYSFEVALRPRSIELMRLMIAESARFPELMSQLTSKIFSRFTDNVARLFEQMAARGLIPDGDHAESAEYFVDLLLGNRTVMIYFGWVNASPSQRVIEKKIDLFIKGRFGNTEPSRTRKRTTTPAS
jgi:TetR/AcrR family transcriptional regulator, mexJK operon transcriptional repressor